LAEARIAPTKDVTIAAAWLPDRTLWYDGPPTGLAVMSVPTAASFSTYRRSVAGSPSAMSSGIF
jgi:hypothetical protein